jgi:hypothetical protein
MKAKLRNDGPPEGEALDLLHYDEGAERYVRR